MVGWGRGGQKASRWKVRCRFVLGLVSLSLISLALTSCGGTETRALSWLVRFEDESLSARATLLRGEILEGECDSGVFLYRADQDRDGSGQMEAPPSLPPGRYSFVGTAQDGSCRLFARGCTTVDLPSEGMEIVVSLQPSEEVELCGASSCMNGRCTNCESDDDCAECLTCDPATRGCEVRPEKEGMSCGSGGMCRSGACCVGCWDGSLCQAGDTPDACGVSGGSCQVCACPTRACTEGACVFPHVVQNSATGTGHVCMVTTEGLIFCWGMNSSGQLGVGGSGEAITISTVPLQAGTDTDWRTVTAGEAHTCALKNNGTVFCWGANNEGQLGLGPSGGSEVPAQVGTEADWSLIDAGNDGDHTCGLRGSSLYCWGRNDHGQLGVGDLNSRDAPTLIPPANVWVDASAGELSTCAIRMGGTLWCWGNGDRGRLGLGDEMRRVEPTQVGTDTDWMTISVARSHTCAIKNDGSLWCWGRNPAGPLGVGDEDDRLAPTQAGIATDWIAVTGGDQTTCGIRSDGTNNNLFCWGFNDDGQVGLTDRSNKVVPTPIGSATDWVPETISMGEDVSCAGRSGGLLECTGWNKSGQLASDDFDSIIFAFTPICFQ